jgi:hypothetical protein
MWTKQCLWNQRQVFDEQSGHWTPLKGVDDLVQPRAVLQRFSASTWFIGRPKYFQSLTLEAYFNRVRYQLDLTSGYHWANGKTMNAQFRAADTFLAHGRYLKVDYRYIDLELGRAGTVEQLAYIKRYVLGACSLIGFRINLEVIKSASQATSKELRVWVANLQQRFEEQKGRRLESGSATLEVEKCDCPVCGSTLNWQNAVRINPLDCRYSH